VPRLSALREALLAAAAILAVYLAGSLSSVLLVGSWNDDGVYLVLGRALATGEGYRSLHLAGAPMQLKYPPGFPAILSLLWLAGGDLDQVQRLVSVLHPAVAAAVAALLWWLARARFGLSPLLAGIAVLVPLLFDASIQYFTIPLSEPWFMLGWAACLVGADRLAWAMAPGERLRWAALTALVAAGTMLVRTQALVLVTALGFLFLQRTRLMKERVLLLGLLLLPLMAWSLARGVMLQHGPVSALPDEGGYLTWFTGAEGKALPRLAGLVGGNAAEYVGQLGPYFSGHQLLGRVMAAVVLLAVLVGAAAALGRVTFVAGTSLGGVALVLLWPFAQDRLLLSSLPFAALAAVTSLDRLLAGLPASRRRGLELGLLVGALLFLGRQVRVHQEAVSAFTDRRPAPFYSPSHLLPLTSRYLATASRWVLSHTTPEDRLLIDYPAGIYLHTGRVTVPANPAESAVLRSVFARPGRYLAERILRDSVTVVVVGIPGSPILHDIEVVRRRCPGVLVDFGQGSANFPRRYRVVRDEACLLAQAGA
jgi:hypothetical protein